MATLLSDVRWLRVLLAVVATHVVNVVLSVVLIVAYSLLAIGPGVPQTEAPWTGSRAGSPPGPCRS
jgi:hypothetical protein